MWTWLAKFVPLADDVFGTIKKLFSKEKDQKKIIDAIKKSIVNAYKKNFAGMNRDIALLAGWKPIVGRVQAIDLVARQWEQFTTLAIDKKDPDIATDLVGAKALTAVTAELKKVVDSMGRLSKGAKLTWNEGGPSLTRAAGNIRDILSDLRDDLKVHKGHAAVLAIRQNSRRIQEETKEFFVFWDKVLEDLTTSAVKASDTFVDSILDSELKKGAKKIVQDWPKETWSDLLSDLVEKTKPDAKSEDRNDDKKDDKKNEGGNGDGGGPDDQEMDLLVAGIGDSLVEFGDEEEGTSGVLTFDVV